jgi:hypothetical protein
MNSTDCATWLPRYLIDIKLDQLLRITPKLCAYIKPLNKMDETNSSRVGRRWGTAPRRNWNWWIRKIALRIFLDGWGWGGAWACSVQRDAGLLGVPRGNNGGGGGGACHVTKQRDSQVADRSWSREERESFRCYYDRMSRSSGNSPTSRFDSWSGRAILTEVLSGFHNYLQFLPQRKHYASPLQRSIIG